MSDDWVYLEVEEIVAETDRALLLRVNGDDQWVPLSQIADVGDYSAGDTDCGMSVSNWIARQKGWA